MVGSCFLGKCHEVRINFNAEDSRSAAGQPGGQAARACAYFDDEIVRRQLRGAYNQIEQVQVDQETLAELLLWPDAVGFEEVAQVRERLPRTVPILDF